MFFLRVASFCVLFLSVAFAPWIVTMSIAAVMIAFFPWFWEAVIIGFMLGSVYGLPTGQSGFIFAFFPAGLIVGILIEEYVKKTIEGNNLIFYFLTAASGEALILLTWFIFKVTLYF